MYAPGHGVVDHSGFGSDRRQVSRGFTASYGWSSGNPHHVPRFHMSEYQRGVPRVDQKYGDHAVVRAPYANESTINDAPLHNDIPNSAPQYHMSCYERPANVRVSRDHQPPWIPPAVPERTKGPPAVTERRSQSSPTQNWMNWKDSSLCDARNEDRANVKLSSHNNSANAGSIISGFHDPRGSLREGDRQPQVSEGFVHQGKDAAHVPHSAPPQAWATSYDSSLSRRRNHDSELSSITPRKMQAAQGMAKCAEYAPASPTTGGLEHGGPTRKSHTSPMGHQNFAASVDSSLCRKGDGSSAAGKYSSNVAALIHGGQ